MAGAASKPEPNHGSVPPAPGCSPAIVAPTRNNKSVIEKLVDYIETHIDEDLSLDKIANELNYSKFYIARIFTEETKCTVYKYIQGRRLTVLIYN